MLNQKCVRCNCMNDPTAIYCSNCRAFLRGSPGPGEKNRSLPSVWELQGGGQEGWASSEQGAQQTGKDWVILCPLCHSMLPVDGSGVPFFCNCGNPFQETDVPMPRAEALKRLSGQKERGAVEPSGETGRTSPSDEPDKNAAATSRRSGPMHRHVVRDDSSLRLIVLSPSNQSTNIFTAREEGDVFGSKGTMGRELPYQGIAPQHFRVWHTGAGWYFSPMNGQTLHNGEGINPGRTRKLADGDFLHAGDCALRIEIVTYHG